jgi:large repetitive protein
VNCFQGTAIVQVTVSSVNDAPVAANDVNSTDEDTTLNVTAPGVLANDTDVEGDPLTAEKVSDPAHGTLTLNTDGSFTYTPNGGFSGSDCFTYKANDDTTYGNVATVDITVNAVNDAPVAVEDTATTDEDTAAVIPVLSNDTEADGDSLSVVGSSLSHPAHGTVELITSGTDAGKVRYTPNANYNGSDNFNYKANDGTADSNEATVSVTVTAVNDAPVAVNDSYSTNQDNALTVDAPGVLDNDSDVDSANLTAAQVLGPSHGQLTINANGSFTYTPDANFSGADSFTYKVHDGSADSNTATVTITVNPVGTPAPMVTSVSPLDKATGVSRSTNVTATFNVAMKAKTLKSQTFILRVPGKKDPTKPTQVSATVTCNDPCTTATLTPSKDLAANTTYTATVKSAVEDTSGKKLGSDYIWSFTTGG